MSSAPTTLLHLSPHPDDEIIGAGATLLGLREAGHRVINLACSLGRREDQDRRLAEVREACKRAGFELVVHDPPLDISRGDDLESAERALSATIGDLVRERGVSLVVSPTPHDGHHGHEVVGRAALEGLSAMGDEAPRWWMWGLWGDLPLPTLVTLFPEARLEEVLDALDAYSGEIRRNDYPTMVRARATVNRVLGVERVFGFGEGGFSSPYAELLTEVIHRDGGWRLAAPRILDPCAPLEGVRPLQPIDWWLAAPSVSRMLVDRRTAAPGPVERP